ncbi:hypothetical protein F5Y08DRAFT_348671 [Xylaria arbuscula]|nr:hypothetical protein F5Y08DRAFT_348671 [Xylaria arbuscula]
MAAISDLDFCLGDLLRHRSVSHSRNRLLIYSLGNTSQSREISYSALYNKAKENATIIRSLENFQEQKPILLHLNDQSDTILLFWSVLLAKGLPVISTPLSHIDEHRQKHLCNLSSLLESPICITKDGLLPALDGEHTLKLHTLETLLSDTMEHVTIQGDGLNKQEKFPGAKRREDDGAIRNAPAFLMLTSGSTGEPKAVCLSSHQIFSSIKGKASVRPIPSGQPLLNWIALDHVASLVEIHLLALWFGVDQIHVHSADIITSPTTFLQLLSEHHVSRSFAPNFFLEKLVSAIDNLAEEENWDLSGLSMITSGGEPNIVRTCVAASNMLQKYGAPKNVITPGFGMTETCAGAIFNLENPEYDVQNGYEVSPLGLAMDGIEMRIGLTTTEGGTINAAPGEIGSLEIRGDVVFKSYYRDLKSTDEAFSDDGWFITGDQARIDANGHLSLVGRAKDVTNINGVKISSSNIQWAVEHALGSSVTRAISFPSTAAGTEQITVAYIPTRWPIPVEDLANIDQLATRACVMSAGHRPLVFALRKESLSLLPTSTLGKVSRTRMRLLFEQGVFDQDLDVHTKDMKLHKQGRQKLDLPQHEAEMALAHDFALALRLDASKIHTNTSIFDLGCTSIDLIRLRHFIETRLGVSTPMVMLMKNPTVRSLNRALRTVSSQTCESLSCSKNGDYDPVIVLKSTGSKAPLWLIHPGVGEILVFVGLAHQLSQDERPIYALRARGFESAQEPFVSIIETVECYSRAIRKRQPKGPYALAGYSYGAMLAFEVAKGLESDHGSSSSVRFLGCFNLPPHIKSRMRHLNWNLCLLHLAYFLSLITEESADHYEKTGFRDMSGRGAAVDLILKLADTSRMRELELGKPELLRWTEVAFCLQSMAVYYEPQGTIETLDVFHALPLTVAAASPEEWVNKHLSQWRNFCRSEPRFHEVGGAHYTMLGPEHVSTFSIALQAAMKARGI